MGSQKSKILDSSIEQSVLKVEKTENVASHKRIIQCNLLDPRSPDVNRTPLARIISQQLKNEQSGEQTFLTPEKILHKKVLNFSSKEMKLLDPRSPSQFIPRTPLNMSIDEENIENIFGGCIEYSGCIEEASCRNFNERLANITFDDYVGAENKQQKGMDENCKESIDAVFGEETEARAIALPAEISAERFMNIGDENISPVVNPTLCIKRSAKSALCSTPISISSNQPKSLLIKKYSKKLKTDEVFIYEENLQSTPAKILKEVTKSRTPFGSLLNHRSKSVENLSHQQQQLQLKEIGQPIINYENSTNRNKSRAASKTNICMIR